MSLFLLFQQCIQAIHQLIVAEFFDRSFLLRRQFALHAFHQPVERDFGIRVEDRVDASEIQAERLVELVEMRFILDQRDARKIIKIVERRADHIFLHRFQQDQELLDRDGNLRVFQCKEKID